MDVWEHVFNSDHEEVCHPRALIPYNGTTTVVRDFMYECNVRMHVKVVCFAAHVGRSVCFIYTPSAKDGSLAGVGRERRGFRSTSCSH